MSRSLLLIALLGLASTALAQTTYSSLPVNYGVLLRYPSAGELADCNDPLNCVPQVSVPEGDTVIVTYFPLDGSANSTSTITVQRCFNKSSTVDRPWRKASNTISEDKQCSIMAKGLAPTGNYTYTPNVNTPPANYYFQVLEVCSGGAYCGKGRSVGVFTIIPINARPGWLIAMSAAFACVGPVALAAFFVIEHKIKKQK